MRGTDYTDNETPSHPEEFENFRYSQAIYVTKVAMASNLLLTGFKFFAGIVGNSSAMIADAIHSTSDFMTDIAVIAGLKIARKPGGQHT